MLTRYRIRIMNWQRGKDQHTKWLHVQHNEKLAQYGVLTVQYAIQIYGVFLVQTHQHLNTPGQYCYLNVILWWALRNQMGLYESKPNGISLLCPVCSSQAVSDARYGFLTAPSSVYGKAVSCKRMLM